MAEHETYGGDGLYYSYDGNQFKIRTPREDGDHFVYLELRELNSFLGFVEKSMNIKFSVAKLERNAPIFDDEETGGDGA